jgi:hypothetical protein
MPDGVGSHGCARFWRRYTAEAAENLLGRSAVPGSWLPVILLVLELCNYDMYELNYIP